MTSIFSLHFFFFFYKKSSFFYKPQTCFWSAVNYSPMNSHVNISPLTLNTHHCHNLHNSKLRTIIISSNVTQFTLNVHISSQHLLFQLLKNMQFWVQLALVHRPLHSSISSYKSTFRERLSRSVRRKTCSWLAIMQWVWRSTRWANITQWGVAWAWNVWGQVSWVKRW